MHGILALGRQRQKGYFKFEVSLDGKVRPCPVTKKKKESKQTVKKKKIKKYGTLPQKVEKKSLSAWPFHFETGIL